MLAPMGCRSTFDTLLIVAWDSCDYSAALVEIFVRFVLVGNDPPERTQAILRNFSETCNTNSPSFASTMALCQNEQTLARVTWRLSRNIIHDDEPSALFIYAWSHRRYKVLYGLFCNCFGTKTTN